MAAKKAKKRSTKSARVRRSSHPNIPQVDVRKVEVTWCAKDGTLKKISINLKKVDGFLWRYDQAQGVRDVINPGDKQVPHDGAAIIIGTGRPRPMAFPERTGCWWDGARWVCPDELDQDG